MQPFVYSTFNNPYTRSIGDLLEHSGDAAANTARVIGQTVAAIPGQMQQQKRAAVVDQTAQLQLDEAKRANKSRLIFEAELRNPSNYNPDGTVDDAKVADRLKKQDVGAWQSWTSIAAANNQNALNLRKTMQDIEASGLSLEEKRRTLAQAHASAIGKLALTAEDVLTKDPENPQHARDTLLSALAFGASQGWIDPKAAHATAAQFQTAQPADIANMLQQFITPELRAAHQKEAADLQKTTAEAAKAAAEAENLKRYASTTPPTLEQKNVTLDGKPDQLVNFNPRTGQMFIPGSDQPIEASRIRGNTPASIVIRNEGAAAVANLPTWATDDSRPSGPEANKVDRATGLTPNGLYQAAVNYIANGQYPQTARGNDPRSQAVRSALLAKVGAIAAASGMDEPAMRAFYKANAASLGQQQKAFDSVQAFMSTADKNAALLATTLKKLPDIGAPFFNRPLRAFAKDAAGDKNMAQFATYLQSVQNEYGRIISQPNLAGQLTDSARHEAEALLDPKATVPQIVSSIQALTNEGNNRVISLGEQIQRIQQRMSVQPGNTPPAAAGNTVTMRAPNGQTQQVPADQVEHYKSLGATVVK